MSQLHKDFWKIFETLAEFEVTQRTIRGYGAFIEEDLDKIQEVVKEFKETTQPTSLKQHSSDMSGHHFGVHCVENGFIIYLKTGTKICSTIEEVVNEMTRHFNLSKIGEKVKLF